MTLLINQPRAILPLLAHPSLPVAIQVGQAASDLAESLPETVRSGLATFSLQRFENEFPIYPQAFSMLFASLADDPINHPEAMCVLARDYGSRLDYERALEWYTAAFDFTSDPAAFLFHAATEFRCPSWSHQEELERAFLNAENHLQSSAFPEMECKAYQALLAWEFADAYSWMGRTEEAKACRLRARSLNTEIVDQGREHEPMLRKVATKGLRSGFWCLELYSDIFLGLPLFDLKGLARDEKVRAVRLRNDQGAGKLSLELGLLSHARGNIAEAFSLYQEATIFLNRSNAPVQPSHSTLRTCTNLLSDLCSPKKNGSQKEDSMSRLGLLVAEWKKDPAATALCRMVGAILS